MDRPVELLSKQLWLVLHRTIISVRMEPTIIVTVLRIIEREERYVYHSVHSESINCYCYALLYNKIETLLFHA